MRSMILLLASVSTLVLAQNVLAISPAPSVPVESVLLATDGAGAGQFVVGRPSFSEESPEAGTMGLLVAGLAGLTIAGGRRHDRSGDRATA